MQLFSVLIIILLSGCGWKPCKEYRPPVCASDYYLILLVDAPHLDHTSNLGLIQSIARREKRDVGHAWIYLQGIIDGKPYSIEGGHSGELGICQAKYFDGIMNYIEYGEPFQTTHRSRYERNPIKYLWITQNDGFFQNGSGGHTPTFSLKIDLTKEQFETILTFIQPENYNYREYSLTHHQCCTFVAQVAALAGIYLDYQITIPIDQHLKLGRTTYTLWQDRQYSTFTFGSVDILERSMMNLKKTPRTNFGETSIGVH